MVSMSEHTIACLDAESLGVRLDRLAYPPEGHRYADLHPDAAALDTKQRRELWDRFDYLPEDGDENWLADEQEYVIDNSRAWRLDLPDDITLIWAAHADGDLTLAFEVRNTSTGQLLRALINHDAKKSRYWEDRQQLPGLSQAMILRAAQAFSEDWENTGEFERQQLLTRTERALAIALRHPAADPEKKFST